MKSFVRCCALEWLLVQYLVYAISLSSSIDSNMSQWQWRWRWWWLDKADGFIVVMVLIIGSGRSFKPNILRFIQFVLHCFGGKGFWFVKHHNKIRSLPRGMYVWYEPSKPKPLLSGPVRIKAFILKVTSCNRYIVRLYDGRLIVTEHDRLTGIDVAKRRSPKRKTGRQIRRCLSRQRLRLQKTITAQTIFAEKCGDQNAAFTMGTACSTSISEQCQSTMNERPMPNKTRSLSSGDAFSAFGGCSASGDEGTSLPPLDVLFWILQSHQRRLNKYELRRLRKKLAKIGKRMSKNGHIVDIGKVPISSLYVGANHNDISAGCVKHHCISRLIHDLDDADANENAGASFLLSAKKIFGFVVVLLLVGLLGVSFIGADFYHSSLFKYSDIICKNALHFNYFTHNALRFTDIYISTNKNCDSCFGSVVICLTLLIVGLGGCGIVAFSVRKRLWLWFKRGRHNGDNSTFSSAMGAVNLVEKDSDSDDNMGILTHTDGDGDGDVDEMVEGQIDNKPCNSTTEGYKNTILSMFGGGGSGSSGDGSSGGKKKRGRPRKFSTEEERKMHRRKQNRTQMANKRALMSKNQVDETNQRRRERRAARTYAEQQQQKEADRIRKANEWRDMTPAERRARTIQRQKRRDAIHQLAGNQWSTFEGAKAWDVPGRDYTFENFEKHPETSALLWYVNNGSWKDREVMWLVAYLHTVERLSTRIEQLASEGGAEEHDIDEAEESLYRLHNLYLACVERNVSFHREVYETFGGHLCIWNSQYKWEENEQLNDSKVAVLEWFACHSGLEAFYDSNKNYEQRISSSSEAEATIDPRWASSLVGLKLKVPENWWKDYTRSTLCDAVVVQIDYANKDDRFFVIECEGHRYNMRYDAVKKYANQNQRGFNKFILPDKSPIPYSPDYEYINLCKTTRQALVKEDVVDLDTGLHNHAINRIEQIINTQCLTPEIQKCLGQKFLASQGRSVSWGKKEFGSGTMKSVDAPLYTCAACGFRRMDVDDGVYHNVSISELDCLKLSDEQRQVHVERMMADPLWLPMNKQGHVKKFESWRAFSVWPAKKEAELMQDRAELAGDLFEEEDGDFVQRLRPKYYHLHPEFVEEITLESGKRSYNTKLCSSCYSCVEENNKAGNDEIHLPKNSIACGVDFGNYHRVGLEPLTLRERQIISKVRHYYNVIKIESNTTDGKKKIIKEHTHSALKGCGILFDHDTPQLVTKLLSPEGINGDVSLQFVSPDGKYDTLMQKSLGSANVSARSFVIYQWLAMLKSMNWIYMEDEGLDFSQFATFGEFSSMIDQCNNDLVKTSIKTCDESIINQTNVTKDDYARVRGRCDDNAVGGGGHDEGGGEGRSGGSDEDFPLRCCYLTSSSKAEYESRCESSHQYFRNVAQTLGIDTKKSEQEYAAARHQQQAKSYRERDPLNEFQSGDEGLVKAFPDVFLFGTAYGGHRPNLNEGQVQHLLMQYTTSAASCRPLLFYLFDQKQRHASIKGMYAKVLSDKRAFDQLSKECKSPIFHERLQNAVKNPQCKDGKYIAKRLVPVLSFGGKKTVFGAMERNESKGEILALGRRFGSAPAFLTFAIDDVNHPTSIRLAMRSENNNDFPSIMSGISHETLKNGFGGTNVTEGNINIPSNWSERCRTLINNPVGAAHVYKNLVHDVMSILVGIKPSNHSGDNRKTVKTSPVSWDADSIGIIGTPLAFFGKTETTGRGSLHFHVVLWGGLSPDLLEVVSDVPELCDIVSSVLDSMYCAHLDGSYHIRDLVMKAACKKNTTTTSLPDISEEETEDFHPVGKKYTNQTARAMLVPPDPLEDGQNFNSHTSMTICMCGIHGHSFTCRKPPKGYHGCRLCKPNDLIPSTKPVWLKPNDDGYDVISGDDIEPSSSIENKPRDNLFPITSPDGRIIVWELKRPDLERDLLPKLEQDELNKKDEILSNLYKAMASTEPDNIVIHDPPKDGNCLFAVLLKGLQIVKPKEGASKNVGNLRFALMNSIKQCRKQKIRSGDGYSNMTFEDMAQYVCKCDQDQEAVTNNDKSGGGGGGGGSGGREWELNDYISSRKRAVPYDCKWGGHLEINLFALKYGINVAVHKQEDKIDPNSPTGYQFGPHLQGSVCIDREAPTIHVYYTGTHYTLLRYNWSWDEFETGKVAEYQAETEEKSFVEQRERWSVGQVDSYQFVEDEHNLLYNLLHGLVIVESMPSNKMSLTDLRQELMEYHSIGSHELDSSAGTGTIGDEVLIDLFAKAKNINVVMYRKRRESLVRERCFDAGEPTTKTIHLLHCTPAPGEDGDSCYQCYSLFMPKLYGVMKLLDSMPAESLKALYIRLLHPSDEAKREGRSLVDRNGFVVDFSPLLASLLGCNTNLLFLGAKEQSKGALFYIGPYINKNGVEVIDSLPLLFYEAYKHAIQYPSVADDSVTDKRFVQHVLTRVLNKMNSQIEVSDTQAAAALLGLSARLCSESFAFYDAKGYQNFVGDEHHASITKVEKLKQLGKRKGGESILEKEEEEEEEEEEGMEGIYDGDEDTDMEDLASECGKDDNEKAEEEYTSLGLALGVGSEDGGDEELEDLDSFSGMEMEMEVDDSGNGDEVDSKNGDDGTDEEEVLSASGDSDYKIFDMHYTSGEHGSTKLYKTDDDRIHAVTYTELYRCRGKGLKDLNRLEYCSLVRVAKIGNGGASFAFGRGLQEKLGTTFHQILRSKQCTPKLFGTPPPPPGAKPHWTNKQNLRRWKKRADQFACYYLIMFRPEVGLYEKGQKFDLDYSWDAFEKFVGDLRASSRAIDQSRLEQMERMINGWRSDKEKCDILSRYRGRNRTMWTSKEKTMSLADFHKSMQGRGGNNNNDEDICNLVDQHLTFSWGQYQKVLDQIGHGNAVVDAFKRASGHSACGMNCQNQRSTPHPAESTPFREDLASEMLNKNQLGVESDEESWGYLSDDDMNKRAPRTSSNVEEKISEYVSTQNLSKDKSQAVDVVATHLVAMSDGRSEEKKYNAPFMLVTGGPGNGKSKLVETFDGMSEASGVGNTVKCAYIGIAAVNIGGSSLCDLFDIPLEFEGDGVKHYRPWKDSKLQRFTTKYDIDNITCIIVDEISTVKPYVLAYLSKRLMEIYKNNKPFGGRAVVLLGDFDQLPPVGGSPLPKKVMEEYDRLKVKKGGVGGVDMEGIRLFLKASYVKLTQQHRSKDPKHSELLCKMSESGCISVEMLKNYKMLSEEDMSGDDGFGFGTIIVTGNEERHELNTLQSQRWASHYGTHIIRWRRKINEARWKGRPRADGNIARVMENDCFFEYFVPGAPGFLTKNINTDIGLANGVEIKYHSLSFECFDPEEQFKGMLADVSPGGIITLEHPPSAINVELYADFPGDSEDQLEKNKQKRKLWSHGSLVEGRVVIPIPIKAGNYTDYEVVLVKGAPDCGYHASMLPMKDHFPIELGFCVTVWKAQVSIYICVVIICSLICILYIEKPLTLFTG